MAEYDVLVVGAGPYGATFARVCKDAGLKVKVIDKNNHIAGICYDEKDEETGIIVQKYGAHIFRTSNETVWNFLNQFTKFNNYKHYVYAYYKGEYYSLPFNMYTFKKIYGCNTPEEAKKIIEEKTAKYKGIEPKNLKEYALKLVGDDIYRILIEGYTSKQWMRPIEELPPDLMRRIKFRYEYNKDYFSETHCGIPCKGYTKMFNNMLNEIDIELNSDYLTNRENYNKLANIIIYTGKIDEFFNYKYGKLEYRSLKFVEEKLNHTFFQPTAVINYTDYTPAYTRIIEHKHFLNQWSEKTIVTYEYPIEYKEGMTPYYTINDDKNNKLYELYKNEAKKCTNILFGGIMGKYKYLDMNEVFIDALKDSEEFINNYKGDNYEH